jgi:hypothetical protein
MNRARRTRRLSAAVFIYLALNIQVKDEGSPDWLLAIPLLPLNLFLWGWWRLRLIARGVMGSFNRWEQRVAALYQGLGLTLTVVGIGCKASLYGLGVTR